MRYFDISGEIVGILLIPITFFYLFRGIKSIFYIDAFNHLQNHRALLISSLGIVILHYILAIYLIYLTEPTGTDVGNFAAWAHGYATGVRDHWPTVGAELYKQFLSLFFYAFGSSSLLLSCVTIFVFTASLLMFLKICILLEIKVKSYLAILLFGGLPGFLLITVEPYREIYLIFFLMASIYYGIKFRMEIRPIYLIFSIVFIIFFGMFHYAAMALSPFIMSLILFFPIRSGIVFNFNKAIYLPIFIALVVIANYSVLNYDMGEVVNLLTINSISEYIDKVNLHKYDLLAVSAPYNYYWHLDGGSFLGFFSSFFQAFLFYMFKPFVWEINSLSSLVLSLEGVVRFALVFFSIRLIFKTKGPMKRVYLSLLLVYIFIESIMAVGTTNAGTASRHHLLAQWIVIVLGGSGLIAFIKALFINASPKVQN